MTHRKWLRGHELEAGLLGHVAGEVGRVVVAHRVGQASVMGFVAISVCVRHVCGLLSFSRPENLRSRPRTPYTQMDRSNNEIGLKRAKIGKRWAAMTSKMTQSNLPQTWRPVSWLLPLLISFGALVLSTGISGQEAGLPTADQVKLQQTKFRKERDGLIQSGAAKRFLPVLMDKAEEFGKRAEAALSAGRFLQASELFRQARWQLPYQSPQVPEHVQRILGNLRLRHGQEINDAAFSPDGRRLATASKDRIVKIWDMENGHELVTYAGHSDHVRSVAFSPDGKLIASAGAEPDIKLWDPETGKDVRTIKGKGTYVTSLAYGRDGKYLVVSNDDKAVRIYEVASGNLKREMADFQAKVSKVAFSGDGAILGAGVDNGQIRLWEYPRIVDNPNQPEYWAKQDDHGASYDVVFSPDKRTLARCGPDGLKLYNTPIAGSAVAVNSHRLLVPTPAANTTSGSRLDARFTCAAFSRDGKTIFTGGRDGLIRLWDPDTGQSLGTFKGHNGAVKSLVFNPAGNQLVSASSDYTVRVWPFDIVLQARDVTGHLGSIWSAAFSPDGSRLVSASADKTVKIWDLSGKVVHSLEGHNAGVTVALFSPDGRSVLSAGGDKLLRLWDADSGKSIRVFKGHDGTITAIDFSPDGSRIVSGGVDGKIKVWSTRDGKDLMTIDTPAVIAAVAFSPDGKQIASGHVDQFIRLWDSATGKEQNNWSAHGIAVSALAYSPNGQWLASGGADHLVRVWPLTTAGNPPVRPTNGAAPGSPTTLSGHSGPVSSVAFRKDNQHIASAGSDLIVKLWKLEGTAAKEAQNYRGHGDWVTSVAFSRDGYYIASASVDRTIKLWEITSREIPLLAEHTGAVQAVAVSPDGKLIASGGTDRSIKLWDRDTGAERMTLFGHADNVLSLAFMPDSKTLVSTADQNDRSIKLWDVPTGKELPQKPGMKDLINAVPLVVVPPDGKRIFAWVPGNERYTTVTAFDPAAGKEIFSFNDPPKGQPARNIYAMAFTPSCDLVALGAKDGSIHIYDLDKKGALLPGDDWFVFDKGKALGDLAFTPDGKQLIVGNEAGDIRICQIDGRKLLHDIKEGHKQRIGVCQVSPDGKRFATAGFDNVVKLWDVASGKELRRWDMHMLVQDRTGFVFNMAFTPDSRALVTANANSTLYILDLP